MPAPAKLTDELLDKLEALLQAGVHPERAFVAVGLGESTWRWLKMRAREGSRKHEKIVARLDRAIAMCEAADVITTRRAAQVEQVDVVCPECGERVRLDPLQLLNMGNRLHTAQGVKAMAGSAAFQRLMLRFPKRWSARVVHQIEEEHEEFLACAERVLAPEDFDRLLDAYIALREGEAEEVEPEEKPPTGELH